MLSPINTKRKYAKGFVKDIILTNQVPRTNQVVEETINKKGEKKVPKEMRRLEPNL
jgi:hypothetical protein